MVNYHSGPLEQGGKGEGANPHLSDKNINFIKIQGWQIMLT